MAAKALLSCFDSADGRTLSASGRQKIRRDIEQNLLQTAHSDFGPRVEAAPRAAVSCSNPQESEMAFSISPPPPPPPLEAVSDEVEKAAEETVDAVENLLEQVLDDAADELAKTNEQSRKTVQEGLMVMRDARREEQRLLAEIVSSLMSFIQDRQQEARRLGADAKTATLIMVAVVMVVLAVRLALMINRKFRRPVVTAASVSAGGC